MTLTGLSSIGTGIGLPSHSLPSETSELPSSSHVEPTLFSASVSFS